ncbi:MAG: diacylglycerol kinase family lipid kinase [Polyangiaceae bacterium]|nr:diacylglycerol kinase family lipid kinase [Polyangiaceae bacterium]
MRVAVVLNPRAGSGAALRRLPDIRRRLDEAGVRFQVLETRGPGDASRRVAEARDDGADCVAVVGGDGTLNEACQAYVDDDGQPRRGPDLALLPAGTGGDFRKTFGIEDDVDAAITRLLTAAPRPIDLGVLDLTADDGAPRRRAFLNITSFGLGGLTDRIVNAGPKWIGGRAAFFVGALRATLVYRNAPVEVRCDGQLFHEGPVLNVAIANGKYFGGGMFIAPDALPDDGRFDIVALGDLGRAEGLAISPKIYQGTHLAARKVTSTRAASVEARPLHAGAEVLIDMDGETPGRLPLRASLLPGALRLRG